jgi:hypothetical protein
VDLALVDDDADELGAHCEPLQSDCAAI